MDKTRQNSQNEPGAAQGFMTGLVLGGLAGAVAMLLLAPQSGRRTRAKIQQKSADLREQVSEAMDDAATQIRAKTREISADISDQATDLKVRGQALFNDKSERFAVAAENRQKAAR